MTRDGTAGFSLIEVLVVLALLGTMAGLTMLSFGAGGRTDLLETEAMLLANRLSMAFDEALLTGTELSLSIDRSGYGVDVWSDADGTWQAHPTRGLGTRHDLAEGIVMTAEPGLGRLAIRPDGLGDESEITFSGSGSRTAWRVSNDGLAARAATVVSP